MHGSFMTTEYHLHNLSRHQNERLNLEQVTSKLGFLVTNCDSWLLFSEYEYKKFQNTHFVVRHNICVLDLKFYQCFFNNEGSNCCLYIYCGKCSLSYTQKHKYSFVWKGVTAKSIMESEPSLTRIVESRDLLVQCIKSDVSTTASLQSHFESLIFVKEYFSEAPTKDNPATFNFGGPRGQTA